MTQPLKVEMRSYGPRLCLSSAKPGGYRMCATVVNVVTSEVF